MNGIISILAILPVLTPKQAAQVRPELFEFTSKLVRSYVGLENDGGFRIISTGALGDAAKALLPYQPAEQFSAVDQRFIDGCFRTLEINARGLEALQEVAAKVADPVEFLRGALVVAKHPDENARSAALTIATRFFVIRRADVAEMRPEVAALVMEAAKDPSLRVKKVLAKAVIAVLTE
jgi:hypothetical protein